MTTANSIKLTKCKQSLVKEQLEKLDRPSDGSLKVCVERLAFYYRENASKFDIAECDTCGGDSDASLEACPYCGEAGAVDTGEQPEAEGAPPPSPEVTTEPEEAPAGDPEPEEEQSPPPSRSKAKGTPPKKDKPAPKAKSEKPAPKSKSTALATETTAEVVSLTDLEERVKVIRQCVTEGAVALHRLGHAAQEISDGSMWKLRTNKEGVPMFRNFKQFCLEELGMTAVHIYRAMGVAKEFSEKEIQGLSGKQVRIVMQLPKDAREEAIEAAKKGETTSKLSERADALRGKKPDAPAPKKAITLAMAMGHSKVKLYKRPTTGGAKVGDVENAKPAKSVKDAPWFALDLANKVRMIVKISTNTNGELTADVEFRRGEPVL